MADAVRVGDGDRVERTPSLSAHAAAPCIHAASLLCHPYVMMVHPRCKPPCRPQVMVFESHTESVARVQQIWKYVPQRLYERFPNAHFFLIVDDDVYIHHGLLLDFVHHRDPQALVLYGPGFCDWGVKGKLKARIAETLGMPMPEYIHVVIGGIMLFTSAAVSGERGTGHDAKGGE